VHQSWRPSLPSPFRETLVLRDLQDIDYKEIAKVTEVPIGTVTRGSPGRGTGL
jgi:DNA-directed RNA polymerase specialized sigma24 family protein